MLFYAAKIGTIFETSKIFSEYFSLWFAEEVDDVADGLGAVELGVAALVAGRQSLLQGQASANPCVQVVQRYMRLTLGEVAKGKLRLRIAPDGKCIIIHSRAGS